MSNRNERNEKRRTTERRVRLLAILIPLVLSCLAGGGFVAAKYYAQSYQRGIAIASGVYFTANYAVAVEDDAEEYFESIVSTTYQGNDFTFEFEVRNYENNILFNENTVTIPYSVTFWLEEAPTGAVYTVECNGETQTITAGKPTDVTFYMHSIAGGSAMANVYTFSVNVEDDVEHTPIPIYAEVRTEAGSMIKSVLKGKMVFNQSQKSESYIESQQFVVDMEVADDAEKYAEILKMSGLTYEIRTVGDGEATESLKLAWNPAVLEIDLFDESYVKWLEDTGATAPLVETRNGEEWYYIAIDIMPYSAETITFFRGTDFAAKATDLAALESYIEAEKYTVSSEETSG